MNRGCAHTPLWELELTKRGFRYGRKALATAEAILQC